MTTRRATPLSLLFAALLGTAIGLGIVQSCRSVAAWTATASRAPLRDARPLQVAAPQTSAPPWIGVVADQLDACRLRTEDLRLALDTLIRTAPRAWNLEHLPVVAAEGWPAWPRVGQAREHVRVQDWDGEDVTPAKGAGR